MVRYAEPSKRSEISCTKPRNLLSSSRVLVPLPQTSCSSIQALLMVSHISLVSAVRTEREFSRAFSMQLRIDDGLDGDNDKYSTTLCSPPSPSLLSQLHLPPAAN